MGSAVPGTNDAYSVHFVEMLLSAVPIPCVSHYAKRFLPPFSFGDKFDICFQGSTGVCS